MLLQDTVVRLRAGTVADGYGNPRRDWTTATEASFPADVQPTASSEDVVDQDRTVTRWRLFLGPYAELLATDRVRWDGAVYEVEGDVERWKRRGVLHHTEAVLIKVTQN